MASRLMFSKITTHSSRLSSRSLVLTSYRLRSNNLIVPTGVILAPKPKHLHTSAAPRNSEGSSGKDKSEAVWKEAERLLRLIRGSSETQLYHWSSKGLLVLTPLAMVLSPSFLNFPVDLGLNVFIPFHAHLGMLQVIGDYVPRKYQNLAILLLWIATGAAALGLLKVNLCGAGIAESVKSLWRPTPKVEKKKQDKSKVEDAPVVKAESKPKAKEEPKAAKHEEPKTAKHEEPKAAKQEKPKSSKQEEPKNKKDEHAPAAGAGSETRSKSKPEGKSASSDSKPTTDDSHDHKEKKRSTQKGRALNYLQ